MLVEFVTDMGERIAIHPNKVSFIVEHGSFTDIGTLGGYYTVTESFDVVLECLSNNLKP